ncbi:MAG: LysR substrate-binding domain-containing protein [Sedimentibacter sp.]
MQIKFVESFLKLYEELNISKASKKLFISQQGLSQQIQSLEKELDIVLFERSKSGVIPTEVCTEIHPHFQNMYMDYSKIVESIENYKKNQRKYISVAFAYGISNGINTNFIFDYKKNNSNINVEIQECSKQVCIEKLLKNEIDIAFLVNPFNTKLFNSFPLAEGYMYVAMHKDHPFAKYESPIDFSFLDGQTIITGSKENSLREIFDYFCTLTNIQPHIMLSSSSSLKFVNSMVENMGIATVTMAMVSQINNPNIKIKRLLTPEPGYLFCCTSLSSKFNNEVDSLLKYIKEYFKLTPIL